MPPQKPAPRETQEQSIKARKNLYFDEKKKPPEATPGVAPAKKVRKTFQEYLRETPAAPLSTRTKAMLWGAGVLVGLLLVATLLHGNDPKAGSKGRKKGRPRRKQAALVVPPVAYPRPFRLGLRGESRIDG